MSKRIKIPVRSLGSEVEEPAIPALAAWIAAHRGLEADLITYQMEESLQVQGGVDFPAAGGRFYEPRLIAAIRSINGGVLSGEPALDHRFFIGDAERVVSLRKGAWCSLPAPHLWGVRDAYYHDTDEFQEALCRCVGQLLRTMRDRGIKGHILLCDEYLEEEIEKLAGPRVLMYTENPHPKGLSILLEHQRSIAVPGERVEVALSLLDEFDINRLIVVDPSRDVLVRVQSHFDPGSYEVGGYCRKECGGYWSQLIDSAFIIR
ncbi:MAG: hypothetical protein LUO93_06710 [Methanomicrobiales archaeon]|nr:hypothetical protein [Methanomicrobiales archaeon]